MYDAKALAQRDALTMLFWGSLLTFINVGAFGLFVPPLIGWPVVALALARLRTAGPDDDRYQRRLRAGVATAWLALVLTVAGVIPWVWLHPLASMMRLAHVLVVASAMVRRFADLRAAQVVHGRWVVARRLTIAMVALSVAVLGLSTQEWPDVITVVVGGLLLAVASLVMYLVAIWTTRGYVERTALAAPPHDVAGMAVPG